MTSAIALTACEPGTQPPVSTPTQTPIRLVTPLPAATANSEPTAIATATSLPVANILQGPRFWLQDTPVTRAMGSDGYTWSQATPLQFDRHGHIFTIAEDRGGNHHFLWSNDGGQTWTDDVSIQGESGFTRSALAYDPVHDLAHVLWRATATDGAGGILYRRYAITRDTSQRVVGFVRDAAINLQLDVGVHGAKMQYEHPIAAWLSDATFGPYGALLCVWSARNTQASSTGNEIRASMRLLSNTSADIEPANWVEPVAIASTTIGNPPSVAYSILVSNSYGSIIYPSLLRKRNEARAHAGDLYLAYFDGNVSSGTNGEWVWTRFPWDVDRQRWKTGTAAATISPMRRAGTDHGYAYKYQLGSRLVEDPDQDRVYFAFSTWKDDSNGDTWSFCFVNGEDVLSKLVDVYSCGGAFRPEPYALTGDVAFDVASGLLVVAHTTSGGSVARTPTFVTTYRGEDQVQTPLLVFDRSSCDIPLLGPGRPHEGGQPELCLMFRDTTLESPSGGRGWFGTISWTDGSNHV